MEAIMISLRSGPSYKLPPVFKIIIHGKNIFAELLNYSQQQASMIFYLRTRFQNLGI